MTINDLKTYKVVSSPPPPMPLTTSQPNTFGQKVTNAAKGVVDFVGAKGIANQLSSKLAYQTSKPDAKPYVSFPSKKEVAGSYLQTAANFIPGVGVGAGLAKKVGVGAATGLAFDVGSKLQQNKPVGQALIPGVGTAVGAGLPVAGAAFNIGKNIVSRLVKGLGSKLSGVSTDTIDKIVSNPQMAQQASEKLAKSGNNRILEENARTILNGVAKIKKEARGAFGKGLDQLSKEDINPQVFKEQTQAVLDKYGSKVANGKRALTNIEFTDSKNIAKASELINKVSKANFELNGRSLRKLADDIESSAYKIATSDERLSFNSFINDLSESLKNAISGSTDKLGKINQKFSQDMQLAEATENIFGKVNFKNLPEVVKASQKLETMFTQKGLAPEVVDNFLSRIGVNPANFKTTEAVRQISNKAGTANPTGLTIGEITQAATAAIITPETVKNLSIATGMAKEKLVPFLRSLKPAARNIVIQALLQGNQQSQTLPQQLPNQ